MSPSSDSAPESERTHYSYAHYANRDVAEGFDALRFSGPIGQHLLREQQRLLIEALSPLAGRHVVDVGTGTGRAAIGLALEGARVTGLDASVEMLDVARRRASDAGAAVVFGVADAHRLPLPDRSADAAVCLRVLMHAIDWPMCVGELCRVARWRVVVDFPALGSGAAIESTVRRTRKWLGRRVEAYRVISEHDVRAVFARHGFRIVTVRRQFVMPIAIHKVVNRPGVTLKLERVLARLGLLRLLGSPVSMVAER
ncbi:MAG: methyltransferase domain-containing protein [Vicinamibacterales bacterium]